MTAITHTRAFPTKLARLHDEIMEKPPVPCPVRNLFGPGVYLRECSIPAGTALVGAAHKTEHFCIVTKGRIRVATSHGDRELVAGDVFLSQPGEQRAGWALEDTIWITVHPNPDDGQDMDVIVPRLVHATQAQLQGGAENAQALAHNQQGDTPCLLSTQPAQP